MTENKASKDVPTAADAIRGTLISIQAWATVFTHWVAEAAPPECSQGLFQKLSNQEDAMRDRLDSLDSGANPKSMEEAAMCCKVLSVLLSALALTGIEAARRIEGGKP